MSFVKSINVNDGSNRKFNDVTVSALPMDAAPELNSFNPVTSDGVARAIAGASGEVPVVTENDNGKVLKAVYDEGGPGVEWGDAGSAVTVDQSYDASSTNAQSGTAVSEAINSVNQVPGADFSDEGKVLTVGPSAAPVWAEPQGGADQPLPELADSTLRFVFEDPAFDPTNDTGCNFTGTSWSKVTESVTRNIWDCTLTSTPSSSAHFAITEPCRVIDGNFTADYRNRYLPYLFKNSTGLQSFEARFGDDDGTASCTETFRDCTSLETVVFNGVQSRVTDHLSAGNNMFAGCRSLTSFKYQALPGVPYADTTGFDIGAPYVFANCVNLKEIQGCCIGSFTTNYGGNGIDLSGTFAGCAALESLDSVFSGANTFGGTTYRYTPVAYPTNLRPIKTAYHAFYGCTALKSFSVPLRLWHSGASAEGMFYNCFSLVSVGLIDFNGIAASMKDMFYQCTSLKTVSLLRTNNVTDMSGAFWGVGDTALEKLPTLDTSSVTNVTNMFRGAEYADGALTMYQQLSQQANPPTTTTGCFTDCGSITHASDLAQIPASWGGTGT